MLPTTGFEFALLDLHPLYRSQFWNNWRTAAGLATSWRAISRIVGAERPAVIVGTGGYAAGPMLFMTGKLKIKGDLALAARAPSFFEIPKA